MNQWMQKIQTMVQQKGGQGDSANLANLLAPGALGGLVGLLIANKSSRKAIGAAGKNALFIGGGAALGAVVWDQYKKRMRDAQPQAVPAAQPSPIDRRAQRLIMALVFAAKADGHIDDTERQSIQQHIHQLGWGDEVELLVQDAITQPLDPERLTRDIRTEDEALEIYCLSCAVVDVDHFMERSYMDALARALKIPDDVKTELEQRVNSQVSVVAVP